MTTPRKLYVAPYGAVFPSDCPIREIAVTNMRDMVLASNDTDKHEVCIITSNLEALRIAIKYAEYLEIEFCALDGVPGGN